MIIMAGTLDFLSVNVWHILMAIGNLLILVLILKKFLFKPVQNIIKQREEEIGKTYSDADKALNEAKAEKELYLKKLDDAKQEADDLIKTASDRAKAESAEIISDARQEAERRRRSAGEIRRRRHQGLFHRSCLRSGQRRGRHLERHRV